MKKICSLLLIIMIINIMFVPIMGLFVFGEDIGNYPLDDTNIIQDLDNLNVNGEVFDITNYGVDESKSLDVIYLAEFGFGIENNQYFSLYLYIYNPEDLSIRKDSQMNKVQMSYNSDVWYKRNLIYISSESQILKYRIDFIPSSFNVRNYCISGIELRIDDDLSASEYKVGKNFKYSGFSNGLMLEVEEIEVLELDVKHTNYRTNTSSLGVDHHNDLNSVWFSVPNDIMYNYGSLDSINCEFYEYKTEPIIVTDSQEIYNSLEHQLYHDVNRYTFTPNLTLGYNYHKNVGQNYSFTYYDWSYNIEDYYWSNWMGATVSIQSDAKTDVLNNIIFQDNLGDVDSDILKDYFYGKESNNVLPIKDGMIAADSFLDIVDDGRTRGYNNINISVDDTFDLLSYDSSHSFFDKFNDYGLWFWTYDTGEDFTNVEPIKRLDSFELSNASDNYLIGASDVQDLQSDYLQAEINNETVFLFRFANTDYFAGDLRVTIDDDIYNDSAYMAQQTMFFDFDIITLTFRDNANYTVLPVISNPFDIINMLTEPEDPPSIIPTLGDVFDTGRAWIDNLLSVLILIILIILLIPLLPLILKFIIWLIMLPIRLIKYIIKQVKNNKYE